MRSRRYLAALLPALVLAVASAPSEGVAADGVRPTGALSFESEKVRQKFETYRAFLEADPEKFAGELAAIRQLENSEVNYHITLAGDLERGIEGNLTTDGMRIIVNVSDRGGPQGETMSLNSRFAHELEHARQFDSGEIGFARNAAGKWGPSNSSYDIGDELKAWSVQLNASIPGDLWMKKKGRWYPTIVQLFAKTQSDEERITLLVKSGYDGRNPIPDSNVVFPATSGLLAGQVVRPSAQRAFFGRVHHLSEPPA